MKTQEQRGAEFRAMHEGEPFVIPNPWDAGSAKVFAGLGFEALATTSSGFAFTLGLHDGGAALDQVIEHVAVLAAATELPVSVDLENGHGPESRGRCDGDQRAPPRPARSGGSIEDFDPERRPLRARPRGRARRGGGRGGPGARASSSRSRPGPRTTSAATPTSTTRSPGCRPTRPPAPTCSTPPACGPSRRSAP